MNASSKIQNDIRNSETKHLGRYHWRGIAIERLHSFEGSFWSRVGNPEFDEAIERMLKRGIAIERLHNFSNCCWKRVGNPEESLVRTRWLQRPHADGRR